MTTKSSIPARYTPASPFSMSLDPHDDGRYPVNVGLNRSVLLAIAEQRQQHDEKVDEVEIEPECAHDRLAACDH